VEHDRAGHDAGVRRRVSEHAEQEARVAATGRGTDPDGEVAPAGEVHVWWRGQDETACGLHLARAQLVRFPAVLWQDVQPASGGTAELVTRVCPRCVAALAAGRVRAQRRPAARP
jgi:hypothetical protein